MSTVPFIATTRNGQVIELKELCSWRIKDGKAFVVGYQSVLPGGKEVTFEVAIEGELAECLLSAVMKCVRKKIAEHVANMEVR